MLFYLLARDVEGEDELDRTGEEPGYGIGNIEAVKSEELLEDSENPHNA